jgi:hypothetical protein
MSKTRQIRAAIVATLRTVPDVGQVHDYERYAASRTGLQAMYSADGGEQDVLLGWFVRRRSFSAGRIAPGKRRVTTQWEITGYRALADAMQSELAMDALVDAIADAFEANAALGGLVRVRQQADPAGVELIDFAPVMFAGVLCHAAAMRLVTEHDETDPAGPCR